jgi:hypothetical protein
MITKAHLIESMRHETAIIKHLATKIPDGSLDYRPTPGQRSLLELIQYMTTMAAVPTVFTVKGNWDHAEEMEKSAEAVTVETFADEMDRQMALIEETIADLDETAAATAPSSMPWGTPTTVAQGLMDMSLKTLVAYRMQLFLYIKSCGVADIGPANCWAGVDMPQPPEA